MMTNIGTQKETLINKMRNETKQKKQKENIIRKTKGNQGN